MVSTDFDEEIRSELSIFYLLTVYSIKTNNGLAVNRRVAQISKSRKPESVRLSRWLFDEQFKLKIPELLLVSSLQSSEGLWLDLEAFVFLVPSFEVYLH